MSGEWPEFECAHCEDHGSGMVSDEMCKRHTREFRGRIEATTKRLTGTGPDTVAHEKTGAPFVFPAGQTVVLHLSSGTVPRESGFWRRLEPVASAFPLADSAPGE